MPTTHTRRQALATLAKSCAGLAILPTLSACASGGHSTLARADRSSGGTRRSSLLDKWGPGGNGGDPLPPIRNDSTPSAHHYGPGDLTGVITRDKWAQGNPVPRLMDKMQPISRITLHHDGMSVFSSTSFAAAAARVESIRSAHRQRNWGDIGYHFLIDPAGRVWQGRSTSWQGAHVKDGNVGNLGICVMGNYQSQSPTETQLKAIEDLLSAQMKYFSIAADRVHTHQELRPTACPGRSLQPRIASIRGGRVLQSI